MDEEGFSPEGEATIEVCDEKLNCESIDISIEGDDNNTSLDDDDDDDIEMQRQKSQASEEREGEEEIALPKLAIPQRNFEPYGAPTNDVVDRVVRPI